MRVDGVVVRGLRPELLVIVVLAVAVGALLGDDAIVRRRTAADLRAVEVRALAATLTTDGGALFEPGATPGQASVADSMGVERWRSAGFTGYGVRVAVVDFGFAGYEDALGRGLPQQVRTKSFRADGDLSAADEHGAQAARIIASIAPQADLYLLNFSTVAELSALVDYLIAERVQVVSFSIGFAHDGPGNGTGPVDDIIARATAKGVFWAVAAGNWAQQHWAGTFTDRNGNSIHEFAPGVEEIGRAYRAEDLIIVSMRWDDPWGASCNDYDLELIGPDGSLVRAARGLQRCASDPVEGLRVLATRDGRYRARVVRATGAAARRIELLMLGTPDRSDPVDFPVAAGSLAEPADSRGVFTVGATTSPTSQEVARFSSRGPTTDGRAKPDIVAGTGPGSGSDVAFGGTSAAAPHVAGAAVLLLDAFPQATAAEIAGQLRARARRLPAPPLPSEGGAGVLEMGTLANVGPILPPGAATARLSDITPANAPISVFRYRGPSAFPARFLRMLTPGRTPTAAYRLDFGRGRFDTFVPRAPEVANTFELVTDGDLLFISFAR